MRKVVKATAVVAVALAAWMALLSDAAALDERSRGVARMMPLYALVSFGAYSLASIAWGLISFREYPEEAEELKRDVQRAKADLRRKSLVLD
eukprot:tig00021464_g21744.t1